MEKVKFALNLYLNPFCKIMSRLNDTIDDIKTLSAYFPIYVSLSYNVHVLSCRVYFQMSHHFSSVCVFYSRKSRYIIFYIKKISVITQINYNCFVNFLS